VGTCTKLSCYIFITKFLNLYRSEETLNRFYKTCKLYSVRVRIKISIQRTSTMGQWSRVKKYYLQSFWDFMNTCKLYFINQNTINVYWRVLKLQLIFFWLSVRNKGSKEICVIEEVNIKWCKLFVIFSMYWLRIKWFKLFVVFSMYLFHGFDIELEIKGSKEICVIEEVNIKWCKLVVIFSMYLFDCFDTDLEIKVAKKFVL
jgi:hypothetical protein